MIHQMKPIVAAVGFAISVMPAVISVNTAHASPDHSGFMYNDLPSLTQRTGLVEAQRDRQIGEWVLRELQQKAPLVEDAWLQDELSNMLNSINAQARDEAPLAMVLIQDPQINAFAVPGGLIGINTGLITKARSADEVASVLAHEVAHVSQRHFHRRSENAQNDLLIQIGGLIASALMAKSNAEAASAIAVGAQAYTVDKSLAYSREHEREADRVGMQIMQSAGYDPKAMPTFFELMYNHNYTSAYIPSFALTHPLTDERISESRQRAANMPYRSNYYTKKRQAQFPFIQWRMRAMSRHIPLAQFKTVANSASDESDAARMGLVTAYLTRDDANNAQRELRKLKKKYGETALYALNQADIYLKKNAPFDAVKTLNRALSIYPENRALTLALGNAKRVAGQYDAARQLITPLVRKSPRDLQAWQLLSHIAQSSPKTTRNQILALRYRAEVKFWKNNGEGALISLSRAKKLAEDSPSQKARINKRYREIEQAMSFKI